MKKIYLALAIISILTSCNKRTMPLDSSKGESHVIQHNDTSEKTDLSMEKTLENMKGEKDEILNFFKSFDINYSAMSETLGLLVKNDKNKSVNLSHTFFEEIPSYSKNYSIIMINYI